MRAASALRKTRNQFYQSPRTPRRGHRAGRGAGPRRVPGMAWPPRRCGDSGSTRSGRDAVSEPAQCCVAWGLSARGLRPRTYLCRRGAASRIGGYERDAYQKPPPGAMPVTPGASRLSKLHRSPQQGKGWPTSIGVQWHAAAPRAEPCTAFVACMENMSGMPSRAPASHRVL